MTTMEDRPHPPGAAWKPVPPFLREIMTKQVATVGLTAIIDDVRQLIRSEDLIAVAVIHRREPPAAPRSILSPPSDRGWPPRCTHRRSCH